MRKYKAVCLDLDGTVYRGVKPIPEAISFIMALQSTGIDPYYITNNSSQTPLAIQNKLQSFGLSTNIDRIMSSAIAGAKYCKENFSGASVMMIGGNGLEEALQSEGVQITGSRPDVVIMGIDQNISYAKLADACLAIRAGAHFIATNADKAIPTERGLEPGNGSFVKLVESATGVKPIVIGKPEPHMLGFLQTKGGYMKEEMVMVGDNYDTDILAGLHFGIDTILVEGGVTSRGDLKGNQTMPTYIFQTLSDFEI